MNNNLGIFLLQEERARKAANRKARIAADLDAFESDQVLLSLFIGILKTFYWFSGIITRLLGE